VEPFKGEWNIHLNQGNYDSGPIGLNHDKNRRWISVVHEAIQNQKQMVRLGCWSAQKKTVVKKLAWVFRNGRQLGGRDVHRCIEGG